MMPRNPPLSSVAWRVARNPRVRAVSYQALLGAGLIVAGGYIATATLENLRARGIATGFGFLDNEAGFAIGETLPLPLFQGATLYFLAALAAGCAGAYGLHRIARRRHETLAGNGWLGLAALLLVVLMPALVLHWSGGAILTTRFSADRTFGLALVTGLANTVKLAIVGCVLTTAIGLLLGIARLSGNLFLRGFATAYIEAFRNTPPLLQIFFWYFGVLRTMPHVRQSLSLGDTVFINNRGIFLPAPLPQESLPGVLLALFAGSVLAAAWVRFARRYQDATGRQLWRLAPSLALIVLLPAAVAAWSGAPLQFDTPRLEGFNFRGGLTITPEYGALLFGLTLYTAAFVAEIVRSGIESVQRGQREAARALGMREGQMMRLVVLPQALRVIIPPLTIQYLSLTKESSLGIAIAYPELVSVSGTMINQIGQAIELVAITMAFYTTLSLLTSALMNWFNARVRITER
jgi:general L-amino acid transport system permease protein